MDSYYKYLFLCIWMCYSWRSLIRLWMSLPKLKRIDIFPSYWLNIWVWLCVRVMKFIIFSLQCKGFGRDIIISCTILRSHASWRKYDIITEIIWRLTFGLELKPVFRSTFILLANWRPYNWITVRFTTRSAVYHSAYFWFATTRITLSRNMVWSIVRAFITANITSLIRIPSGCIVIYVRTRWRLLFFKLDWISFILVIMLYKLLIFGRKVFLLLINILLNWQLPMIRWPILFFFIFMRINRPAETWTNNFLVLLHFICI